MSAPTLRVCQATLTNIPTLALVPHGLVCTLTCRWIAAYSKFVRNVSATYNPSPEIFLAISHCTTGNASMKYCADTRAAYESMKAEGMRNVHFLDVTQNGTGFDYFVY
jgi:hypothetical protein